MCLYISGSSNSTSVKHLIHNYRGDGNIDLQNIIADGSSSPFVIPVCVCELLNSVQLSVTPCTVARQASLSVEFSRQEYWSGLPCPSAWDLPNPGTEPASPVSPALLVDSLPVDPLGKHNFILICSHF